MDYMERYHQWLADPSIDEDTKVELRLIAEDEKEIKERFYKELEFGTGGLRGIIGTGSNRMNFYTVGKATQGLANYIKKQGTQAKGVAIAYDSRHMSPEFARIAGLVLAANGIPAFVYPSLRPTPMLSFAVRRLGCTAGIVVTASHNPPEYNGYKVYWADGAQVVAPRDTDIIDEVNAVTEYGQILRMEQKEAEEKGLYHTIAKEIDRCFDEQVLSQRICPEITEDMGENLTIIYTPIHGSGNEPVRRVLKKAKYKKVFVVPEQEEPDPDFTTVGYPNPEDPNVFTLAKKLSEEKNGDIIVGTDPDCDRVGAMVKDDMGEYVVLTGNMVGALLTEYILSQKAEKGTLPENGVVIKTIVSTELIQPICDFYGVKKIEVLTGFKFIGEKIKEFEETGAYQYLFGFEESYGYLAGTYARDKDAVVATLLLCEMAAYYKKNGMTLYDGVQKLYEKYGYYLDGVKAITLKGLDGVERIQKIMASLRETTPKAFGGKDVVWARDYKTQIFRNLKTGEEEKSPLPISDVLYYILEDGTWLCVRPSGTEPKLKFYIGVKGESLEGAKEKLSALAKDLDEKLASI
ncbi:phospho-sugar mutase [Anaerotignum propionicum]|jgi:phosphoglucomutase|uniref:phosphoglucomutase (alpha-D-glucose-1,6-bisphosphate-dependent) n=1 Tax=Anaerotignum propionicum DSM 1682 TaxID=991789 RepID=A0A110A6Q7_ANAPI|nr:phospho-sugar mutase [Anaerotignum propionicum]AMJ39822.1 phosphoglucomutase [Anaerotignum propionicum DSM 1682]SHE28099.1 alpha-phosphoglucomutase [[Clostridium] propionicum DSM 1682] [Anaerotignum propionicum DSM 1682]